MKDLHQRVVKLNFLAQLKASTYILVHDHSPRGFSGLVQLNGIGRMHVKVPLAAAKGSWMILERTNQVRCFWTWVKARPQHWEIRALLFTNNVRVL